MPLTVDDLPPELAPPKTCPFCNTGIVVIGAFPRCPNYLCPRRVYGRCHKYVSNLDIKGVGDETLLQLCDLGLVKTPADLYHLMLDQYKRVERRGERGYEKFIAGLLAKSQMTTAEFFASLGIEGSGTWEAITAVPGLQYYEDILKIVYDAALSEKQAQIAVNKLAQASRVSPEKAANIIEEIHDKKEDIERLLEVVTIKRPGALLAGKSFCFTGSLSVPRNQVEAFIKNNGGSVSSSVGKLTSYVVTNDPNDTSSKLQKARQLGYTVENGKIIDEKKLIEILGVTF